MYAQDFDMDTASWSCNALGAYIRLLNYSWINGSLPTDINSLSRIARLDGGNFKKCWSLWLKGKFQEVDGVLVNRRMEEEREKRAEYIKKQSLKGEKSGEVRRTRKEPRFNHGSTTVRTGRQPKGEPEVNSSFSFSSSLSFSFESFYTLYPKKKAKGSAEKAWAKISPDNTLTEIICTAVKRAKKSKDWLKEKGKYIPHPATWLNAKGWEDEIPDSEIIEEAEQELRASVSEGSQNIIDWAKRKMQEDDGE